MRPKVIVGVLKLVGTALLLMGATAFAEEPKKEEEKAVEIWMQRKWHKDHTTSYYAWIGGKRFSVKYLEDSEIEVGLDLGDKAYIKAKKLTNAMIFWRHYDPKGAQEEVRIVVGGSRPNDVTIEVPIGTKIHVTVDTLDNTKLRPKPKDDDD